MRGSWTGWIGLALLLLLILLVAGGFLALVVNLWFLWLPLLVAYLVWSRVGRLFRRRPDSSGRDGEGGKASGPVSSGPGQIIETEYRVEDEDDARKQ